YRRAFAWIRYVSTVAIRRWSLQSLSSMWISDSLPIRHRRWRWPRWTTGPMSSTSTAASARSGFSAPPWTPGRCRCRATSGSSPGTRHAPGSTVNSSPAASSTATIACIPPRPGAAPSRRQPIPPAPTYPGFADEETALFCLSHPLVGFYHRLRVPRLGAYRVWHDRLAVQPAELLSARFALFDRLGLVNYARQQFP